MPTLMYAPTNFIAAWFFGNCKMHHIFYLSAAL